LPFQKTHLPKIWTQSLLLMKEIGLMVPGALEPQPLFFNPRFVLPNGRVPSLKMAKKFQKHQVITLENLAKKASGGQVDKDLTGKLQKQQTITLGDLAKVDLGSLRWPSGQRFLRKTVEPILMATQVSCLHPPPHLLLLPRRTFLEASSRQIRRHLLTNPGHLATEPPRSRAKKHQATAFLLLHKCLPLGEWFFKSGIPTKDECPYCDHLETFSHAFHECRVAEAIWTKTRGIFALQ